MATTAISSVPRPIRKLSGTAAALLMVASLAVGGARKPIRQEEKVRTDRYGDPLPEGALARLGTIRFRQGFLVYRAIFSPDGKTIACACAGRGLCLWDAATGKELRQFGQAKHANAVAFSPDGKLLASQDKGRPALFDVASGEMLGHLAEAEIGVASVAFAPDGKSLAVARYQNGFTVWDMKDQAKSRKRFEKGKCQARCLAFSPDSKMLATGGADKIIHLWDTATGEERGRLTGHENEVSAVAFCADGRTLASVSDESSIRLWDVAARKSLRVLDGKHDMAATVAFSRDGKMLASGHSDGVVALWNVKTGTEIRHWRVHHIVVKSLEFSADGATLVSGAAWASGPRLWDVATGKEKGPLGGHHAPIDGVAFSSDGRSLLSTGRDRLLLRWELASGLESIRFNCPVWAIEHYKLSPTGDMAATWAYKDDVIRLWDVATNKERHMLGKFPDVLQQGRIVAPLAFSSDGRLLAFGGTKEHVVLVWDVASGKERKRYKGLQGNINCVAFSPDGKSIAAGTVPASGSPTIGVWDVAGGEKRVAFSSVQAVQNLVFSPDGRLLASSNWQGPTHLWDVETGHELRPLSVAAEVYGLAFSRDGKWLAGAGADRDEKVHVWEVNSGQEVRCFAGHFTGAMCVAFAPDGRSLASGGGDSTVLLWDLTGRMKEGRLQAAKWTPRELEKRWIDLASSVGPQAVQALWDLVAASEQVVPLIHQRIKPIEPVDAKRVERLIGDLDSDDFETRTKATAELESIVDSARQRCEKSWRRNPRWKCVSASNRFSTSWSRLPPSVCGRCVRFRYWSTPLRRRRRNAWKHWRPVCRKHS